MRWSKKVITVSVCGSAFLICIGLVSLLANSDGLRKGIDVPEPCLGNTPEELAAKCGSPEKEGSFIFRDESVTYRFYSFENYTVQVLFHDGIAHVIIYREGDAMLGPDLVRVQMLSEKTEAAASRFAVANLKGDKYSVERDGAICVVYKGENNGISVVTLPMMAYTVCACTELGGELVAAYNEQSKAQRSPERPEQTN